MKTIFADTREKHYAVGLSNCATLEMAKGIHAAVEKLHSPVIISSAEEAAAKSISIQPQDALRFAAESECDALAIAIGTAHGVYSEKTVLDPDCLAKLAGAFPTPLVPHRGGGPSDNDFGACVAGGISKINIFTHNKLTATCAAHFVESAGPFGLMPFSTETVKHETMHHMRVFGSGGKA